MMFKKETKILIVDDMAGMRLFLAKKLKSIGFENILEADDGTTAWELLNTGKEKIEVVFSDVNMPNMTGVELLKKVRSHKTLHGIPFFIISAEKESKTKDEALDAGVTQYIVKPFTEDQLKGYLYEIRSLIS
jgi:two-component system chemotaxis response regulator CheY